MRFRRSLPFCTSRRDCNGLIRLAIHTSFTAKQARTAFAGNILKGKRGDRIAISGDITIDKNGQRCPATDNIKTAAGAADSAAGAVTIAVSDVALTKRKLYGRDDLLWDMKMAFFHPSISHIIVVTCGDMSHSVKKWRITLI